jgi:hypothetical protein
MATRSFGICLRFAFVSMVAVWLAGCALPPVLSIVSSAADGVSFIAAGKSFTDVALSAMTDKDCAVLRIVTNNEICREASGDQRAPEIIVAPGVVARFAAVDETSDSFYMLRRGEAVLTASAGELNTSHALLDGFADGTELFALVLDDGTLEVFAHEAARAADRSNMRLVARISGYGAAPETFRTLHLNGANIAIADIIV